jgi:hypothetical protein
VSAGGVFFILVAIAASDVATGWIARLAPSLFLRGDPSLEAMDWGDLRPELEARQLLLPSNRIVATTHWIEAAKIGYALGPRYVILCLSDDPRGFQFTTPPDRYVGSRALLLARTARGVRTSSPPAEYLSSVTAIDTVPIRRAGRVEFGVAAFRVLVGKVAGQ